MKETDPRFAMAAAVRTGAEVIGAVRPEHMTLPTPCGDFDVRGMLGHLVEVLRRVGELGRGQDAWNVEPATGIADDGWLDAWQAAAHEAEEAWSDEAAMKRQITLPWSDMNGADTLRTSYVSEITVHTWDLATAIGFQPSWDERALAVAYAGIQEVLPENRREAFDAARQQMPEDMRDFPDPFGSVVPTADDAPLIDKLVAWNGRQPG